MAFSQEYDLYRHGTYIMTGTKTELAEHTGLSISTIYSYASSTARKTWDVYPAKTYLALTAVNIPLLLSKAESFNYTRYDLAENLGIHKCALDNKLGQRSRFTENEISTLEDLLYLEAGGLLH